MNQITENEKTALNYYSEQWTYRNKHYWGLVVKHIYIVLTIILFPNITEKVELLPETRIPICCFPILGIFVSAMFVYLLCAEGDRMAKQMDSINEILEVIGYEKKTVNKKYKIPLSKIIPIVILFFHILVACTYLFPKSI